jgi:hypothetical protein
MREDYSCYGSKCHVLRFALASFLSINNDVSSSALSSVLGLPCRQTSRDKLQRSVNHFSARVRHEKRDFTNKKAKDPQNQTVQFRKPKKERQKKNK